MKLVNLTPHRVNIIGDDLDNPIVVLDAPGQAARVEQNLVNAGSISVNGVDVPVWSETLGVVSCLPDARPGVLYVVSRVVADAAGERDDLVVPADFVRDQSGSVVACRGFVRVAAKREQL